MTLVLIGCGDSTPRETTLSALSSFQNDFNGRPVIVSGTLRTFDEPRHFWIENEALDRVALQSTSNLMTMVDQEIQVHGTFTYSERVGRRIEVTKIVTLPWPPDCINESASCQN